MSDQARTLQQGQTFRRLIGDIVQGVVGTDVPAFETAVVTSVLQGRAHIRRLTSAVEEAREFAALGSLVNPKVGDTVICARYRGTLVILGRLYSAGSIQRGSSILPVPIVASGAAAGNLAITPGTSYVELDGSGWFRRMIPAADVAVSQLRLSLTVDASGTTGDTKGIQITDLSDVELYKYEWTTPVDLQAAVSPWLPPVVPLATNQVVKIKAKHSGSGTFSFNQLNIDLLVGN